MYLQCTKVSVFIHCLHCLFPATFRKVASPTTMPVQKCCNFGIGDICNVYSTKVSFLSTVNIFFPAKGCNLDNSTAVLLASGKLLKHFYPFDPKVLLMLLKVSRADSCLITVTAII